MNSYALRTKDLGVSFIIKEEGKYTENKNDIVIRPKEMLNIIDTNKFVKSILNGLRVNSGINKIIFEHKDVLKIAKNDITKLKGKYISLIMEKNMISLNSLKTIEKQFSEIICSYRNISQKEAHEEIEAMLIRLNVEEPKAIMKKLPLQLNDDIKHRVQIALNLLLKPKLIIVDESYLGNDSDVKSHILDEMENLREKYNTSILFISNNISTISNKADKIAVMYNDSVVEYGERESLLKNPVHPYTKSIINNESIDNLSISEELTPELYKTPKGCNFCLNCKYASYDCIYVEPEMRKLEEEERMVSCHCVN